jgi:hypothetical protein
MSEANKTKKIMIASSVYGFETPLIQMCALIEGLGFRAMNSHYGTIVPDSKLSNLENCINAVAECDVFIGIIRPFYGTGVIGDLSITHTEFREAIRLDKRRYFLAHDDVLFCRKLLKQFMYDEKNVRTDFRIKKTTVLDDIRVIDLYDEVVKNHVPVEDRTGNWIQQFKTQEELYRFLNTILEAEK